MLAARLQVLRYPLPVLNSLSACDCGKGVMTWHDPPDTQFSLASFDFSFFCINAIINLMVIQKN